MSKQQKKIKPRSIFLLIILCIIFSWIVFFDMSFNFSSSNKNLIISEQKQSLFPQFFMNEFKSTQFDELGNIEYEFSGASAKHFQVNPSKPSDSDFMDIVEPVVIFFQPNEPPWTLQAETGKALQQGDSITLSGNVAVNQFIDTKTSTKITTDELTLKPRGQFAETQKPVMIDYPRAHYEGLGMEVDFNKKVFTLMSEVKGIHEAPQR